MATSIRPHRPVLVAQRRLRPLSHRRSWLERFWDPREMFGFKITLLLGCYLLSAAIT
ncbi:hypothetical protein J7643_19390 [bacterium]|nr:hypothetical protein [bacterium]